MNRWLWYEKTAMIVCILCLAVLIVTIPDALIAWNKP